MAAFRRCSHEHCKRGRSFGIQRRSGAPCPLWHSVWDAQSTGGGSEADRQKSLYLGRRHCGSCLDVGATEFSSSNTSRARRGSVPRRLSAGAGLSRTVENGGEQRGGAQGRNRTTDTMIFSHVLYQLSYLGIRGRPIGRQRRAGVIVASNGAVQNAAARQNPCSSRSM